MTRIWRRPCGAPACTEVRSDADIGSLNGLLAENRREAAILAGRPRADLRADRAAVAIPRASALLRAPVTKRNNLRIESFGRRG
ncbi:hypothetical protein DO72_4429 [Burkholderia pseudomallei]|nr:hypothetical protein DO72_4429 [Burkholderia pseudomallei]